MSKRLIPIVAIALIALFAAPTNVMAGPFGLFKRCQAKRCAPPPPACCAVPPCCSAGAAMTVAAEAGPITSSDPSDEYYAEAYVWGMTSSGPGMAVSDRFTGAAGDCPQLQIDALANARLKAGNMGISESGNDMDTNCSAQVAVMKTSPPACQWEVTFKIWCCNGTVIDFPVRDARLDVAKHAAKGIACHQSAFKCDKKIRCCRWIIRRIPAPSPAPCCR